MDTEKFSIKVRDGLTLRFIRPEEAETLFNLVNQNRAYLRKMLPWVDDQTGPDVSKKNIEKRIEGAKAGETLDLGIYQKGKLVGSMGFNDISAKSKKAEIGYWLAEKYQGRGIMTDCVRALVSFGFRELKLHRIQIRCAIKNPKSSAIPERLGFVLEGINREDEFLYNHFESSRTYSTLVTEWKG